MLLLGEVAGKTTRADGWMDLATAGHVLGRREPADLESMAERFGHRTLKKVFVASELFGVEVEPTPKGGLRTIYRINPRYTLQIRGETDRGPGDAQIG